jgi:hypothetical protein
MPASSIAAYNIPVKVLHGVLYRYLTWPRLWSRNRVTTFEKKKKNVDSERGWDEGLIISGKDLLPLYAQGKQTLANDF